MNERVKWPIYAGFVVLVVALLWAWPYFSSRRGDLTGPGNAAVGTSGRDGAERPGDSGETDATLYDLETMTGVSDPHELIGRRVDFHAKVVDVNNYTTLWLGMGDRRVLVVLARDNRSGAQRDSGAPSPNNIKPVQSGQTARITGTIQEIPYEEARLSWGLSDEQRRALGDMKVYIRADRVIPEG